MARDNDFSSDVKLDLERRAGHQCSFPHCTRPTDGPSDEDSQATSKTGMACHIIAASDGKSARRRNSSLAIRLTTEEIKSAQNGIWLCYSHGKQVDTDEVRFSIEMLRTWRRVAELRAQIYHETGKKPNYGIPELADVPLVRERIDITGLGGENEHIGAALNDCAVACVWGEEFAYQVIDVLIELVRNSLTHGSATVATIEIEPCRITFTDSGRPFDPLSLANMNTAGGGQRALKAFIKHHGNTAALAYQRIDNKNHLSIGRIRSADELEGVTPCVMRYGKAAHADLDTCGAIYVILPRFFSTSDATRKGDDIVNLYNAGKQLIFVAEKPSRSVLDVIEEKYPSARIVIL
jgi:hypothetical protein